MSKFIINDGTEEIPKNTDETIYIVGKNGTYLKKRCGIVESLVRLEKVHALKDVQQYAKLHISKIPGEMFSVIVDFFRKVYEKYKSESMVLLYYNEKRGTYKIKVPNQEVSSASIDYTSEPSPKDYVLLCSIHSHANFSAFHSGTDKHDEKNFDGLHITVGNLKDENVDICASVTSNGGRFPVSPLEYIDGIEELKIEKIIPSFYNSQIIHFGFSDFENDVFEKEKEKIEYETRYKCLENVSSPKHWLNNVKERVYQIQKFHNFGFGNFNNNNVFEKFPYLNNKNKNLNSPLNNCLNNPDILTKIDDDSGYNPCEECVYRDYKVELQQEDLEDILDEFPGLEIE